MCEANVDFLGQGPDDNGTPSCGAVILLSAGKVLKTYFSKNMYGQYFRVILDFLFYKH